ncbi:hypothetical protein AB4Z54_64260, partial [Streptomyces sp. MCAF7]
WQPGTRGRMVVDLGAARPVRQVETEWTAGAAPGAKAGFSMDGITYRDAGTFTGRGRVRRLTASETARYVSLEVDGSAHASVSHLRRLTVR